MAVIKQLQQVVKAGGFREEMLGVAELACALQSKDYEQANNILKNKLPAADTATVGFYVACTASLLARHGKSEDALQMLMRGLEVDLMPYDLLMMNSDLKRLEKDPRYEKILTGSHENFRKTIDILKQSEKRGQLPPYLRSSVGELLAKLNFD